MKISGILRTPKLGEKGGESRLSVIVYMLHFKLKINDSKMKCCYTSSKHTLVYNILNYF